MMIRIVIPIYKQHLSPSEEHSLRQCLQVLYRYPVTFVTFPELNVEEYRNISAQVDVDFEYFDQEYFESVSSYNRLLLSRKFYLRFQQEDYLLIYQLDALVFKDELAYWCEKNFDYIGAPWFTHNGDHEHGNTLYRVGNGGVSLRKTASFLERFDKRLPLSIFPFYVKNIRKKKFFSMCIQTLKIFFLLLFSNKTVEYYLLNLTDDRINEDTFWSDALARTPFALKVPDVITAAHFCIEKSPSYLYHLIGEKLPFSCHAYEKYEYESFWRNKIELATIY